MLANSFLKDQILNISGLWATQPLLQGLGSALGAKSRHGQYVSQSVQLHSNKTLFPQTGGWPVGHGWPTPGLHEKLFWTHPNKTEKAGLQSIKLTPRILTVSRNNKAQQDSRNATINIHNIWNPIKNY